MSRIHGSGPGALSSGRSAPGPCHDAPLLEPPNNVAWLHWVRCVGNCARERSRKRSPAGVLLEVQHRPGDIGEKGFPCASEMPRAGTDRGPACFRRHEKNSGRAPASLCRRCDKRKPRMGLMRITMLGVSLTAGYGLRTREALLVRLQAQLDGLGLASRVTNQGGAVLALVKRRRFRPVAQRRALDARWDPRVRNARHRSDLRCGRWRRR